MARRLIFGVLATAIGFGSGCKTTSEAQTPAPTNDSPRFETLRVTVNGTGSALADARESAVKSVWEALPGILARHSIRSFEGDALSDDGFQARRIFDETFDLQTQEPVSELALMPGVIEGQRQEQMSRRANAIGAFFDAHSYTALLAGEEGRFSDLNGLFARLAESDRSLNILVTDLADTKKGALEPIPNPQGEAIRLIILWVPEDPTRKGASDIARRMTTWEQFAYRRTELRNAIPWAEIYPHNDLGSFRRALDSPGSESSR